MTDGDKTPEVKVPEKTPGYFVANSLTVMRAGMTLGAGLALSQGNYGLFRDLMVGGFITDILDGPVAKLTKSTSPEGAARERFADIAFYGLLFTSVLKSVSEVSSDWAVPSAVIVGLYFLVATGWAMRKTRKEMTGSKGN